MLICVSVRVLCTRNRRTERQKRQHARNGGEHTGGQQGLTSVSIEKAVLAADLIWCLICQDFKQNLATYLQ